VYTGRLFLLAYCCWACASHADSSAALFDPNRVVKVEIQIEPDSWNQLRAQQRTYVSLFRGACLAQPFAHPFTWFPADLTIDGQARANIGVRKKGFLGSLDISKPALKLDLTEFQANDPVYGTKKLTLNNAKQDPALIRQCLGYDLFTKAGLPAPRCNFAEVIVNGASLGVYVNVEEIRKPMLARYFANTEGNLYEGTFSDFHPLLVNTFEAQSNEFTNDRSDLDAVITALDSSQANTLAELASLVDLDAFVRYWAMEALVGQWDGFTSNRNNYYAYHDPSSDKFHFIPWGADTILADGYPIASLDPAVNKAVFAYSAIARRLVDDPQMRVRYLQEMQALLDTVWEEAAIQGEIDRMQNLLGPYTGDLSEHIQVVRDFVSTQRMRIATAIAEEFPSFPPIEILNPCLVRNGSVSGAFVAEWGTTDVVPPFQTGAATISGRIDGAKFRSEFGGADGGLSIEDPNPHLGFLNLYFQLERGPFAVLNATLDPSQLTPGAALAIDGLSVDAVFFPLDGGPGGFLDKGSIKLRRASSAHGATVCGTFEAATYMFSLAPLTSNETLKSATERQLSQMDIQSAAVQLASTQARMMQNCPSLK
jgi:spore coat protein CotH